MVIKFQYLRIKVKALPLLLFFLIMPYFIYSQQRFNIGGQIYSEQLLSINGIMCSYQNIINTSKFDISPSMTLGNVFLEYHFDRRNSIANFLQFTFRHQSIYFYEKNNGYGRDTDFGDLMWSAFYFRNVDLSKKFHLKLGAGVGLQFSSTDELNSIFDLNSMSGASFNNMNAYFFNDNPNLIATTKTNFKNNVDIILIPKCQLDFTEKFKSYLSVFVAFNYTPFDYMGVKVSLYDKNNQLLQTQNANFKNNSIYFGIGYTYSFGKKVDDLPEFFYD